MNLTLYTADRAGEARDMAYIRRIEAYCRGFEIFPVRGPRRDDLMPGLRSVGFERRVTLAFHVETENMFFDRILYSHAIGFRQRTRDHPRPDQRV